MPNPNDSLITAKRESYYYRDSKSTVVHKIALLLKNSFKNGDYDSVRLHTELLNLFPTVDRNTLSNIVTAINIACNEYCQHIEEFGSDI